MAEFAEEFLESLAVGARERLLYLGFGDGAAACRLARRAAEGLVLGVDPSDDQVRQARRRGVELDNIMFVAGTPEAIPWQENFFSVALTGELTAAWPQPERALGEILRVLAPGGRLYLAAPADPWAGRLADQGFREIAAGEVLAAVKPPAPRR